MATNYYSDYTTTVLNNNSSTDMLYKEILNRLNDTFENDFKEKIASWWKVLVIIIIIESCIGLVGNVLSLIVWNIGKRSSKMSCSTYFKILAASDILTITSGIFGIVLPYFFGLMETNYCAVLGIVFNILIPFAPQLSAWIIVSISIERMLSLCFPFRFRKQGYKRRAWLACFVIIILLVGINYNMFLCSNFVSDDEFGVAICECVGGDIGDLEEVSMVWFLCIIPFLAVTFCNFVIIVRLCRMSHSTGHLSSSNRQNRLRPFTRMCIGAAILHCVSVMPLSITMYYFEEIVNFDYDETDAFKFLSDIESILTLMAALLPIFIALFFLNNSINFLLYCFTGTNFKQDFKELCFNYICRSGRKGTPRQRRTETSIV